MLFDRDILNEIDNGAITISPFDLANLGPASYDVTLSPIIQRVDKTVTQHPLSSIDITKKSQRLFLKTEAMHGSYIIIRPYEFVLCSTIERVTLRYSVACVLVNRSSVARWGIEIESAGFIDPGFDGQITLEVYNKFPYSLELTPGMRIGQLVFYEGRSQSCKPYRGKYQEQSGPTQSRLFQEFMF